MKNYDLAFIDLKKPQGKNFSLNKLFLSGLILNILLQRNRNETTFSILNFRPAGKPRRSLIYSVHLAQCS